MATKSRLPYQTMPSAWTSGVATNEPAEVGVTSRTWPYVTFVLSPAQLLAVARRELVTPVDRVPAVRTLGVDADF
ncbi:hypothetical protein [Streptomyces sp. NPDC053367]|uniref:hypothetical protein n=1 Tax=Streptomyces sp. NPDC053367 TaxID=3365700 RepID=UPI0037D6D5A0